MSRAELYHEWIRLRAAEPGISRLSLARRIGVSETTLRRWENGIVPAGVPDVLVSSYPTTRIARESDERRAQNARAIVDHRLRRNPDFEAALADWRSTYAPHAFALPARRMAILRRQDAIIRTLSDPKVTLTPELERQLQREFALNLAQVRELRREENHLIEQGMPSVIPAIVRDYLDVVDVEPRTGALDEFDRQNLRIMAAADDVELDSDPADDAA